MSVRNWLCNITGWGQRKKFLHQVCINHACNIKLKGLGYSSYFEAKCIKCHKEVGRISFLASSREILAFYRLFSINK